MHNLDQTTGSTAMAYTAEEGTPWHKLGTTIPKGASATAVLKAAHLNWRVERTPVLFTTTPGEYIKDERHQVIYRDDTGMVLDVTGPQYVPTQNIEVLEFFQEYVEAGDMFIDTAGSLNDGKVIWAMARLNEEFRLGKDVVQGRVLFMNPHQYGKGMIVKMVHERVVCHNTLTMALAEGGSSVKIWHNREFTKDVADHAKSRLGIAKERFSAFKADAKSLAAFQLTAEQAIPLLAPVFGKPTTITADELPKAMARVIELFSGAGIGASMPSAKGTAWGLLNGLTQYLDHDYGRSDNRRLTNAWLGQGEVQKRQLLGILLEESRAGS